MIIYKNNGEKSVLASAEFDDHNHTGFFFVKNEVDVEKAKELLVDAGQSFVAQSYVKGHTVLITQGTDSREALFAKLADAGEIFTPEKPEKPTFLQFLRTNGWKIRGGSSVIGQSMTLFSAFNAVSAVDAKAGKLTPKFDPSIGAFAVLNLAANFTNYIFGGQKEEDIHGLEKFDGIIAEEVNRCLPEGAPVVSADSVRKLSYMDEQEMAEHNKSRNASEVIKRNSVRLGEVGLRTLGSMCMMFNYRQIIPALGLLAKGQFKQAFMTAKVSDPNTFLAGCGMVSGKMMGLFAKTYDPNNPPKTYIEEIRQKVLWTTSSFTEMVAQSFVAFDRAKNKRLVLGGKAHADYTGVAGNVLLTVPPYPTRLVLPYGEKVLDVQEVEARLLDELPKLPHDKIPGVVARVASRMVEHMGEKAPPFSEIYNNIMNKLDKFHKVCVWPHSASAAAVPTAPDIKEQITHFAEKVGHKIVAIEPQSAHAPKTNAIRDVLNRDAAMPPLASAMQLS